MDSKEMAIRRLVSIFGVFRKAARSALESNEWNLFMAMEDLRDEV